MKILIAEDEYLESKALQQLLLKYYAADIETILLADNGVNAVELAKAEEPEILFMDIQLPLKNGIDACTEIRSFNRESKIIMLTAYGDFEYARQSIKNNVLVYIVKPYSIKTLRETMDKAIAQINASHKEKVEKDVSHKLMVMLQREFMHKVMVNFRLKESIIEEYVRMLGIYPCSYRIILLRSEKEQTSESEVRDFFSDGLGKAHIHYMDSYFTHTICIIAYAAGSDRLTQPLDQLLGACQRQYPQIRHFCSDIQERWERIALVFYESLTRLNHRDGGGDDIGQPEIELEGHLTEAVISRDDAQAREICRKLVREAYLKYGTANDFGYYLIYVYRSLLHHIQAIDEAGGQHLQQGLEVRFSIPYRGDEEQAFQDFFGLVQDTIVYLTQNMQGKNGRLIRRVKKFIEEHSSEDISLEEIARYAAMSKYYLSRTFKTVEGENIKDYLQKVRIENAKRLLLAGETAASAAYKAGFGDPAYFSKCFKKLTGVSPASFPKMKPKE